MSAIMWSLGDEWKEARLSTSLSDFEVRQRAPPLCVGDGALPGVLGWGETAESSAGSGRRRYRATVGDPLPSPLRPSGIELLVGCKSGRESRRRAEAARLQSLALCSSPWRTLGSRSSSSHLAV